MTSGSGGEHGANGPDRLAVFANNFTDVGGIDLDVEKDALVGFVFDDDNFIWEIDQAFNDKFQEFFHPASKSDAPSLWQGFSA